MIVVSAFEAFGGMAINPTEQALLQLRDEPAWGGKVSFMVLPVVYGTAARLILERMRETDAVGAVMFGLASGAETVRVECRAHNWKEARLADAEGQGQTPGAVIPGGFFKLDTWGPVHPVFDALQQVGAPTEMSYDPGRYVCNATYYEVLSALDGSGAGPLFVHVPATVELDGSVTQEKVTAWMRTSIESYLKSLSKD